MLTEQSKTFLIGLLEDRISELQRQDDNEFSFWMLLVDQHAQGIGEDPGPYEQWGTPKELAFAKRVLTEVQDMTS